MGDMAMAWPRPGQMGNQMAMNPPAGGAGGGGVAAAAARPGAHHVEMGSRPALFSVDQIRAGGPRQVNAQTLV